MPQSHFFFARLLIIVVASFSLNAHATEWRDCEKAKLRALQLQQNTSKHKISKSKKKRHAGGQHQSVEEIDTWLWKNCREYSYELRQLEQERM